MICPYCEKDHDRVIDSRASDGRLAIRRRRECMECHRRFTTYERVEKTARLVVVKRDGSRAAFDSRSILKGVQAACGKRPIPEDVKLSVVQEVEEEIHREFDREVPSAEIGRRVAVKLRNLDLVSYIRFASEYYNFRTLDDFADELNELRTRPTSLPNQQELFVDGA